MLNSKFEFKVEFGLEIRIRPKSMVDIGPIWLNLFEFGHEIIKFCQKTDFLALKTTFLPRIGYLLLKT